MCRRRLRRRVVGQDAHLRQRGAGVPGVRLLEPRLVGAEAPVERLAGAGAPLQVVEERREAGGLAGREEVTEAPRACVEAHPSIALLERARRGEEDSRRGEPAPRRARTPGAASPRARCGRPRRGPSSSTARAPPPAREAATRSARRGRGGPARGRRRASPRQSDRRTAPRSGAARSPRRAWRWTAPPPSAPARRGRRSPPGGRRRRPRASRPARVAPVAWPEPARGTRPRTRRACRRPRRDRRRSSGRGAPTSARSREDRLVQDR